MSNETNQMLTECAVVQGVQTISKKWIIQIICELNWHKVLRYSELKSHLVGVTNTALTNSLKDLISINMVTRTQYNEIPIRVEYSLTKDGEKLLPTLCELAKLGENLITHSSPSSTCKKCYEKHITYVPFEKESVVTELPLIYNKRYLECYDAILKSDDGSKTTADKLEEFLLGMLNILTMDGANHARWMMSYYAHPDTPELLDKDRPQYKIICNFLDTLRNEGILTLDLTSDYLADQLSKQLTGMVCEWAMNKCQYDVIEYNTPMIHAICTGFLH